MEKIKQLDLIYLVKKAKEFEVSKSSILQKSDWATELKIFYYSMNKNILPEKYIKNNSDSFENMLCLIKSFEDNKIFELYQSCENEFLPTIDEVLKTINSSFSHRTYLKCCNSDSPQDLLNLIHFSSIDGNILLLSKCLEKLKCSKSGIDVQKTLNKALFTLILNHQKERDLTVIRFCLKAGAKFPDFNKIDLSFSKEIIFETVLCSMNKDLINLMIKEIGKDIFDAFSQEIVSNLDDSKLKNELEIFLKDFKGKSLLDDSMKNFNETINIYNYEELEKGKYYEYQ